MEAMRNRGGSTVLRWLRRNTATIGFVILSGAVVIALYFSYQQGQDRERQIAAHEDALAYICETTKVIDSAAVQLEKIDTRALADPMNSVGEDARLLARIDVFNNLHFALVNDEPCRAVE